MRATYLLLLLACLAVVVPLEVYLRTRVLRRWCRLLLTLAPVVGVFTAWDVWAIHRHHWRYDAGQTVGVLLPGRLPLEELLFFLVVPGCAVLTFEAVRAVRGGTAGDEPPP